MADDVYNDYDVEVALTAHSGLSAQDRTAIASMFATEDGTDRGWGLIVRSQDQEPAGAPVEIERLARQLSRFHSVPGCAPVVRVALFVDSPARTLILPPATLLLLAAIGAGIEVSYYATAHSA